jgi:hypothetical protein
VGKTAAIVQSCYVPWKGYFDLVQGADVFVLYDDVQYTRRDWRNRNRIKTAHGPKWITIPVQTKGRFEQRICDVEVSAPDWAERHFESIRHAYARAEYFDRYADELEALYESCAHEPLTIINERFLRLLCKWLGITTTIIRSETFKAQGVKSDRLIDICTQLGATRYLSGPSAQAYLDESAFNVAGIGVVWMDYAGYPEYRQLHPPFVHEVSVLDLLFNEGPGAPRYLKTKPSSAHSAIAV